MEGQKEVEYPTVLELIDQGYRRVSRSCGHLSRIDRPDWKEYMAKKYAPWSIVDGMKWVRALSETPGAAEDHYRRCYSKDIITVPKEISDKVPASCYSDIGFVAMGASTTDSRKTYIRRTIREKKYYA